MWSVPSMAVLATSFLFLLLTVLLCLLYWEPPVRRLDNLPRPRSSPQTGLLEGRPSKRTCLIVYGSCRQGPELVVGSTGRTTAGATSRLSKSAFLKAFLGQTAIPGARDVARSPLLRSHLPLRCSYAQLKHGAINYCEARAQLMRR